MKKSSVFDLPVHPAAEIFPMLAEDELQELCDDIAAHGLLQPLAVKDGLLVDGRNRREACKRLGLDPPVEELNGVDPLHYVISTNIKRRHLTKGQRAMAVAMIYPESQHGGARSKGSKASVLNTVASSEYINHARTVLQWLPKAADAVLAGTRALNEAYQEAQHIKIAQGSEESRSARLREQAPDLADLITEGRLTLATAEAAYAERVEEVRRSRHTALDQLDNLERFFGILGESKRRLFLVDVLHQPEDRQRAREVLSRWQGLIKASLEAL